MSSTKSILRPVVREFHAPITQAERHGVNSALHQLRLPSLQKNRTFHAYYQGLTRDQKKVVLADLNLGPRRTVAPAPTGYVKAKIRAHTAAKKAAAAPVRIAETEAEAALAFLGWLGF